MAQHHPEGHPQGGHHRRDGPRHARRASRIPPHTRPLPPENRQQQASTSIIAIGPARAELRRKSARPVPRGRECSNALPLPDEIETAYLELKSAILGGRVLRARTPDGIEQEVYALLVTYQAIRTAIADAAATIPGTDPDRASFTVALSAARDQVILAAGVTAGPAPDLAGTIGRHVLASLMPPRRLRTSPRVVKRAISKYNARGKTDRTTRKAALNVVILTPPLDDKRRTLTNRPWR